MYPKLENRDPLEIISSILDEKPRAIIDSKEKNENAGRERSLSCTACFALKRTASVILPVLHNTMRCSLIIHESAQSLANTEFQTSTLYYIYI